MWAALGARTAVKARVRNNILLMWSEQMGVGVSNEGERIED
jgi:hypothetical protein